LFELRSRAVCGTARLSILSSELLIFQPDEHLTFLDLIALLNPNPGNAAGYFGIGLYSVMRNNVAGRGQDNAAGNVSTFRRRAHYFDLRRRCEKEPVR